MIKIDDIQPWMNWLMYPATSMELRTGTDHTSEDFMLGWHPEIFQLDLAAMSGKFNIVMYYHVDDWTANTPPCNGWNIGGVTADNNWSWWNGGGTQLSASYVQVTAKTRRYYHVIKILPTCHFERVLLWYYNTSLPTPRPEIYNHGFFFVRTDGTDTFNPIYNRDVTFGDHGRYTFHCELVEQTNRGVAERSLQFGVYEGWRCLPSNVGGRITINGTDTPFYQAFHPWKVIPLPLFTPSSASYATEKVDISLWGVRCTVDSYDYSIGSGSNISSGSNIGLIMNGTYFGNEKSGTTERTVNYTSEVSCADAWIKCYSGGTIIIAPALLTEETWESGGGSLSFSIPAPKGDRSILPMMATGKHWAFMAKGRNFDYFAKGKWEWAKITVTSSDVDADANSISVNVERWT